MSEDQKLYIKKNSRIHSSGLFAKFNISSGTRIIEYRGLKITKAQSDKIADVHIEANKKAKQLLINYEPPELELSKLEELKEYVLKKKSSMPDAFI